MNTMQSIRRALDARTKDIAALGRSRELSLALTTCQQGRMLLGVTLRLMGASTPYPESDNPESPVVAPAADTCSPEYEPQLPENPIAAVKTVRDRLAHDIVILEKIHSEMWPRHVGRHGEHVFERGYTEILLAKNWLGMELSDRAQARDKKAAAAKVKKPEPLIGGSPRGQTSEEEAAAAAPPPAAPSA